jgi:hypothetical protein
MKTLSNHLRLSRSASVVLVLTVSLSSLAASPEAATSLSLPVVAFPRHVTPSQSPEPERDAASDDMITVVVPVPPFVERGTRAADVVAQLGPPALKFGRDAWVYWDYRAAPSATSEFDTLVLLFSDGRVTHIRLVSRPAVEALAERFATGATGTARFTGVPSRPRQEAAGRP